MEPEVPASGASLVRPVRGRSIPPHCGVEARNDSDRQRPPKQCVAERPPLRGAARGERVPQAEADDGDQSIDRIDRGHEGRMSRPDCGELAFVVERREEERPDQDEQAEQPERPQWPVAVANGPTQELFPDAAGYAQPALAPTFAFVDHATGVRIASLLLVYRGQLRIRLWRVASASRGACPSLAAQNAPPLTVVVIGILGTLNPLQAPSDIRRHPTPQAPQKVRRRPRLLSHLARSRLLASIFDCLDAAVHAASKTELNWPCALAVEQGS